MAWKPIFCEKICPECKKARAGDPKAMEKQNAHLAKFGPEGCPFGKARTRYYGVTPDQPVPPEKR